MKPNDNKVLAANFNPHPQFLKLLRGRSSYCCDHCERQYDDDICDSCFAKKVINEIFKPAIKNYEEALLKCQVALTPYVFIDEDARKARDLAAKALANQSPKEI